ncbi:MAG: hypothetical protein IPM51_03540 [Sphingobacteriaceae bacterium]|nr:hypothetical protein [Sphingobacteriaceae bacterium]
MKRKLNNTKKLIAISTLIFFAFVFVNFHPFYLSVCEFKYKADKKTLEVSVKQFTNDLEEVLAKKNKTKVDLINGKDTALLNGYLREYILANLKLNVNGKDKVFKYLGYEREEEAVWAYLEVSSCEKPTEVRIENSLLYELIKTQINIVHFELDDKRLSKKVENPDRVILFSF